MQLAELQSYLALRGNVRSPDLEAEIFANKELTTLYLHNLCKTYSSNARNYSHAELVYWYSHYVLNTRWPEAEPVIIPHHFWWLQYNRRHQH